MPHVVQQEATLAHLESQVAAALALRSSHEYRHWLLLYARYLVNEGEPRPSQTSRGPAAWSARWRQPRCERKGWGRVHVAVTPGSLCAPRPSEPRRSTALSLLRAHPAQQGRLLSSSRMALSPALRGPSMSLPQELRPLTHACPPPQQSPC